MDRGFPSPNHMIQVAKYWTPIAKVEIISCREERNLLVIFHRFPKFPHFQLLLEKTFKINLHRENFTAGRLSGSQVFAIGYSTIFGKDEISTRLNPNRYPKTNFSIKLNIFSISNS